MKPVTVADAPAFLNLNDKAMWVLGFNAAVERAQADEKPWPFTGSSGPLCVTDADEHDAPIAGVSETVHQVSCAQTPMEDTSSGKTVGER